MIETQASLAAFLPFAFFVAALLALFVSALSRIDRRPGVPSLEEQP